MIDPDQARHWLHRLVGEWELNLATSAASEHPGFEAKGRETVRSIGSGIMLESTSLGSDGSPTHSITLLCSDRIKGRITGSVMTTAVDTLFVYEGTISPDGRSLILETEGPAMTPGRETDRYRDVFVMEDDSSRYMAAELWADDGGWREFMRTTYRRTS